jgi:hypothetical protein
MNKFVDTVQLSDVEHEPVKWLWPSRIPFGKVTILDGDPGVGKSTIALDLAARVSSGRPMPHADVGVVGNVLVITAEDGLADTVRPRLEAAGADISRVHGVTGTYDLEQAQLDFLRLPADLGPLMDKVQDLAAQLVIIDPLFAYLDGRVNSWRDHDVRRALTPLADAARHTSAAVICIRHFTKNEKAQAKHRGGGSIGILGAARAGFLVVEHPQSNQLRVFAPTKMNLCESPPALAFQIEPHGDTCRIAWGDECDLTADALLAAARCSREGGPREVAAAFLKRMLSYGGRPAADIEQAGEEEGINPRTLRRAATDLGVQRSRQGFGPGAKFLWSLPGTGHIADRSDNIAAPVLYGDGNGADPLVEE